MSEPDPSWGAHHPRSRDGEGMLGLFEARFHAHFDDGDDVIEFPDFEQARRMVLWDGRRPVRIDRIETVWLPQDMLRDPG